MGGKARSVADIAYEVGLVNDHVRRTLAGEELFEWPDGFVAAPADLQSKEAALTNFRAQAERVLALVDGLDEEAMERSITTEHGETNGFERIRFMTLHLWYHSGQLNFIQTLLGDDGWHWS